MCAGVGGEPGDSLARVSSSRVPFLENSGQIGDGGVSYYARTFGGTVSVCANGEIVYALPERDRRGQEGTEGGSLRLRSGQGKGGRVCVVREALVGARRPEVIGKDKSSVKVSRFKGRDPSKWRRDIPAFDCVSLGEVYEGVELALKAYGNNVEKLFTVEPGSDPKQIKLRLRGAADLAVNKNGELELTTALGVVKFTAPVAYQERDGKREQVTVAYEVDGDSYGFTVGDYDRRRPLVIDPLLASTFIGGGEWDKVSSIGLDGDGNVFVAGQTYSAGFPTTGGAYDETYNGFGHLTGYTLSARMRIVDGFLGFHLYRSDIGNYEVEFSDAGNVFIGRSESGETNGPVEITSTNIGSLVSTQWYDIAIVVSNKDISVFTNGTHVLTGQDTNSTVLPGGTIAIYTSVDGGGTWTSDAYVDDIVISNQWNTEFEYDFSDSNSVAWDWDLSDWGPLEPRGWVVEPGGDDYVLHGRGGSWGEPEEMGGNTDMFVAKFDASLSNLIACTFLGGNDDDGEQHLVLGRPGLGIDNSGNVYVAEATESSDFPVTGGAYDTNSYDGSHAFVSKLNNDLDTLLASTVVPDCEFTALKLDSTGGVYVAGHTWSAGFRTIAGAYDRSFNGFGVWSNYTVRAQIQIIEGELGIDVHNSGLGEYQATFDTGQIRINKYTSSTDDWTNLVAVGSSLVTGQWYDVEVSVSNGYIAVYTNDVEALSIQDVTPPILPGGEVEIWAWNNWSNALCYLDELRVEKNDDTFYEEYFDDQWPSDWRWDQCDVVEIDSNNVLRLEGDDPQAEPEACEPECDAVVCRFDPDLSNLSASTFFGGVGEEEVRSIDLDAGGNVYICGKTESADMPTTPNAYDRTFAGGWTEYDVSLRMRLVEGKLTVNVRENYDPEKGHTFRYCVDFRTDSIFIEKIVFGVNTDLGQTNFSFATGTWYDVAVSVAEDGIDVSVNGTNRLSVTDTDPLVIGGVFLEVWDTNGTGAAEAYVDNIVVTNSEQLLVSDNFEDGDASDWWTDSEDEKPEPKGWGVVLDGSNYVYRGQGCAWTYPPQPGGNLRNNWREGFVAKLDGSLQNLQGATFLGHDDDDEANAIVVAADGSVYVGGYTWSQDFPTTPGAYSEGPFDGHVGFISRFSDDLTNLLASTLLGTSGEIVNDLAIGSDSNIYAVGSSWGGLPMTWDPFDGSHGGARDAIAAKLDPALTNLIASTFLGGSQWDEAYALCIDTNGNVYVAGVTESWDFPTSNAYEDAYSGDDGFIARLDHELSGPLRPIMSVSPDPYDFGYLYRNEQVVTQMFSIVNIGKLPLVVGTISLGGGDIGEFTIVNDTASGQTNVAYSANTTTVSVVFAPTSTWGKAITLIIPSNDPDNPTNEIAVYGTGCDSNAAQTAFLQGLGYLVDYAAAPHETNELLNAHQSLTNALAADPNHYGACIYASATRIVGLAHDTEINDMLDDYGASVSNRTAWDWGPQFPDPLPTNCPTTGEALTLIADKLLTEIDGALDYLGRIPTNWNGSVILLPTQMNIDEATDMDAADVQFYQGGLEMLKAALWMIRAHDLDFNMQNLDHLDTVITNITVDGDPGDWAGVTPLLEDERGDSFGSTNADIRRVYAAMDGSNAYVMIETYAAIHPTANIEVNLNYKPGQHAYRAEYDDLHVNIYTNSLAAWTNEMAPCPIAGEVVARGQVAEASIPLSEIGNPDYFTVTFANIWSTTNSGGDDPSDIEIQLSGHLDQFDQFGTITNASYYEIASTSVVRSLNFCIAGLTLVTNEVDYQTDDMIIIEPADFPDVRRAKVMLAQARDSMLGVTNGGFSVKINQLVNLGYFWESPFALRDLISGRGLQGLVMDQLMYQLDWALGNVANAGTNYNETLSTNDYFIDSPVDVDDGDLLRGKAEVLAYRSGSYVFGAYDWDIDLVELLESEILVTNILDSYPQIFTVTNAGGLASASNDLLAAVDTYLAASDFVRANRVGNTNHWFGLMTDELTREGNLRRDLEDVETSMSVPTVARDPDFPETVHLAQFFATQYVTRAHLPDFTGTNDIVEGSFPDPTFNGVFPNWGQWEAAYYLGLDLADSDLDGMADLWETNYFGTLTRDGTGDFDGDGLDDLPEYQHETDPTDSDSDGDGFSDGWEVAHNTDPNWAADPGSAGVWHILESASGLPLSGRFGGTGWTPVPADYDGDGLTDLAIYEDASGTWRIIESSSGQTNEIAWGWSETDPVPADYNGDGACDIGVFDPGTALWFARTLAGADIFLALPWGATGDIAVPADYDGDGIDDVAVFRPSTGLWSISGSTNGPMSTNWGTSADTPVPADYDGDGRDDVAIFRPSTGLWSIDRSSSGPTSTNWGAGTNNPVPADYDGDGSADIAVFVPSNGQWSVIGSSAGPMSTNWGMQDDIPVPGDYDGDGTDDIGVYSAGGGPDSDGDGMPDPWEILHFGDLDETGSGDFDLDGLNDRGEYAAGTVPTNAASRLAMTGGAVTGGSHVVRWSSVSDRIYEVQGTTNVLGSWSVIANNQAGTPPENAFTNVPPPVGDSYYYRALTSYDGSQATSVNVLAFHWLDTTAGPNGNVDVGDGWYTNDALETVTASPSVGHHFVNWSGDVLSTNNPLALTMDQSYAVQANFAVDIHNIAATGGPNGTVTPSGLVQVAYGSGTSIVVQANTNWHIASVLVDGEPVGAFGRGSNTYTHVFTNVTGNRTIEALFNREPTAVVFASPTNGVAPLRVTLSFSASTDVDGEVVRCEVDREDDGHYEISSEGLGAVILEYQRPGIQKSMVRVVDDMGAASDPVSVTLDVWGGGPVAVIEADQTNGVAPLAVNFTGTNSTTATGHVMVVYEWDVNGDGLFDLVCTNGVVAHTYREPCTNTAVLRITDDRGLQDTNRLTVIVTPAPNPPSVTLSADPESGTIPLSVTLTAAATDDGVVQQYCWDIDGDGEDDLVTTSNSIVHRITKASQVEVGVVVVDDDGLSAADSVTVHAMQPPTHRVWISKPKKGAHVTGDGVSIIGRVAPGGDTISVQFEYKLASGGGWSAIGVPVYPDKKEYKAAWDASGLLDGSNYVLRAIADTGPASVTSELVTVTVDSTAADKVGGVEEGVKNGKHNKKKKLSKDESSEVGVYDGTYVTIPLGTVMSNVTIEIELTGGNTNAVGGSNEGQKSAGANRKVTLIGNPGLNKPITIIIPYPDADDDGIVDGLGIPESTLTAHVFDIAGGIWKRVLSYIIDKDKNQVIAKTYHLSEFGLFGSKNLLHPANGGVLESYTSQFTNSMAAANLTDGNKSSHWRSEANPSGSQEFVYSFKDGLSAIISEATIHNWTRNGYRSTGFEIEMSINGSDYWSVTNGTLLPHDDQQEYDLGSVTCRTVRLTISGGVSGEAWELMGFAVNGVLTSDVDLDGLMDYWEIQYLGNLDSGGADDPDGDSVANTNEYNLGLHPGNPDTDGDGLKDGDELLAGTGPLDAGSFLGLSTFQLSSNYILVEWSTVYGKGYWVQRSTNLLVDAWSNLLAFPVPEVDEYPEGSESLMDFDVPEDAPVYYRIKLHIP